MADPWRYGFEFDSADTARPTIVAIEQEAAAAERDKRCIEVIQSYGDALNERDAARAECLTRLGAAQKRIDALAAALLGVAVEDRPYCWCEDGPVNGDDGDQHTGYCRAALAALGGAK